MRPVLSSFAPPPVRHGIKTAMAAALAYALTQALHIYPGQWAVVSALIAMQATVADAIQAALQRVTGTILGAVFGIAFLFVLPPDPLWTSLGLITGVTLFASLNQYSPRYTLAALTVIVVLLGGVDATDKVAVGLERMLEITIGVGTALLVSIVIWPVRLVDNLRRDLASQYVQCAIMLDDLTKAFLGRQQTVLHEPLDKLADKIWNNHQLLVRVKKNESLMYYYDHAVLELQVRTLDRAVLHLQPMIEALNDYEEPGYDVIMAPELRHMADSVMATLRHLGGGTPAAPAPDLVRALTTMVAASEKRLQELREAGDTNRLNLHQMMRFYTFFHSLRGMSADLLMTLDRIQSQSSK